MTPGLRSGAIGDGDPLPPDDRVATEAFSASIAELYTQHSTGLVRQLSDSAGCTDQAAEVVHEAYSRLLRLGPAKSAGIAKPRSYLAKVAMNLIKDSKRNERRKAEHARAAASCSGKVDQVVALESRDTLRRLEAAIAKLKPKTRQIFLAHRLDGLSYAEIANEQGLSVKGVEKHMAKAIAKITRFLDRP